MSKKTFLALKTKFNNPFATPSDTSFLRFLKLNFYDFYALLFIINFGVLMPFSINITIISDFQS
jgi:hypothetical protein